MKKKKQALITKEMQIDEIIDKYPQTKEIFTDYGLHCIGCYLAREETLEQGAIAHGFDKKIINKMIKEANDHINSNLEK